MRRLIAPIAVAVWITLLAITVSAPSVNPVDSLREQTVHVLAFSGTNFLGDGSGVMFRGGYLFTAAHVVPDECDQRLIVEVHSPGGGVIAQLGAEILWVDRVRDFSLARVTKKFPFKQFAIISTDVPKVGDVAQHVGFMLGHKYPHAYSRGVVTCLGVTPSQWTTTLDTATLLAMPGSSGGGVFDERGRLTGVLVGVTPVGLSFYVPLSSVKDSLADSGLALTF